MTYRMLISIILFFLTGQAYADYRLFSLIIVNQKNQTTRQIQSTLDPEQFKTLYPLNSDEIIAYVDTWRCRGRTDWLQTHCENPNKEPFKYPSLGRSPASN
jgi:hypothetical protein